MELKINDLNKLNEQFNKSREHRIAQNAAMTNGILKASINQLDNRKLNHDFSINLKQGDITNQKQSGRCWIFSALNLMRYKIIKELDLKTFELSQNYPLFYDKLEKSNYFLQSIIKTLNEPLDSRLVTFILKDPLGDGGQWDMLANLIKKYGVVPKYEMDETFDSSNTKALDEYLTKLLRNYAKEIRKDNEKGVSLEIIENNTKGYMEKIYNALCISLGTPPKKFDFEVRNEKNEFIKEKDITPIEFFNKYVNMNINDIISLINAPTKDKPYNETYTVDFLGNVVEGNIVKYLNLPIEKLKEAAIAQMKDGNPVWFGCDVGQFFNREGSILDIKSVEINELFGVKFDATKSERLDYGESLMTHAMVFMGVDLDENDKPIKWRVENSWGKDSGDKGYLAMSDEWFDEFVYQVAIDKKYLSDELLKDWEKEPKHLNPWDPMGSLAK